ncbi:hypothetical protein DFJ74DRAFT_123580 [Hyaloraphidium curvatum]|nr:hypothetical protein DFJ74DRAFT_123580 [Hyaloraphidium curvatum]
MAEDAPSGPRPPDSGDGGAAGGAGGAAADSAPVAAEALTAAELRAAADRVTMASLRGFAFSCACIFGFLGLGHRAILPPPVNIVMAAVAFSSSAAELAFYFLVVYLAGPDPEAFYRKHARWAQPGVLYCSLFVLLNSTLHVFLTREMWQSSNIMLLVVGSGALFFEEKWCLSFIALSWGAWAWCAFSSEPAYLVARAAMEAFFPDAPPLPPVAPLAEDPLLVHFIFGLASSTLLTYTIFRSRLLLLRDEEQIKKHEVLQRERLGVLTSRYAEMAALANSANQAKSDFLRNVSHEVRTPLNGILGLTDELLHGSLGTEEREMVETVRMSGEVLLAIVEDILDFAKIEANRLKINTQPMELRPVLRTVLRPLEVSAHKQGLELSWSVHQDVPATVLGDRNRIGQVLINLVGNAIKFTEAGKISIDVEVAPDSGVAEVGSGSGKVRVRFSVRDTGIGIPASKVSIIFLPFTQADGSNTRKHGGSGLGLAISRRIVELMGGELYLASSVEGVGSEFVFVLPMTVWEPPAGSTGLPSGTSGDLIAFHGPGISRDLRDIEEPGLSEPVVPRRPQPLPEPDVMPSPLALDPAVATPPPLAGMTPPLDPGGVRHRRGNKPGQQPREGGQPGYFDGWTAAGTSSEPDPASASSPSSRPARRPGQPVLPPLRVLVAEDNKINQLLIQRLLGRRGHAVHMCANGLEAFEAYERGAFDIFISDVQMPIMGGIEVCRKIREVEAAGGRTRLPIIALTAHALDRDREACLAAGFDAWLPKPLDQDLLFRTMAELTGNAVQT